MESLGLSQKDAQSRNKWRRRIKGQLANPGSPGKMAVKMECVCVRVSYILFETKEKLSRTTLINKSLVLKMNKKSLTGGIYFFHNL